jgi:hypothetical protein
MVGRTPGVGGRVAVALPPPLVGRGGAALTDLSAFIAAGRDAGATVGCPDLIGIVAAAGRGLSADFAVLATAGDWPFGAAPPRVAGAGLSVGRADVVPADVVPAGVAARPLPLGGGACSVTAGYPLRH